MNEVHLEGWEAFEAWLREREAERQKLLAKGEGHVAEFLFRGHSDACWSLETTLERQVRACSRVSDYLQRIRALQPEIESYVDRRWMSFDPREFEKAMRRSNFQGNWIPTYEFMIYLRHHGFPSPLLDWTKTPYIAAFFAFIGAHRQQRVAIFAYLETLGHGKTSASDEANIRSLGSTVRTHPRHFRQQCEYTVCVQEEASDASLAFASHEKAFDRNDPFQDQCWKVTLPAAERAKVLRMLNRMNLNAYTLFGSEDSLIQSLGVREFDLRTPPTGERSNEASGEERR